MAYIGSPDHKDFELSRQFYVNQESSPARPIDLDRLAENLEAARVASHEANLARTQAEVELREALKGQSAETRQKYSDFINSASGIGRIVINEANLLEPDFNQFVD